jgi:glycosyltransferase involved in cell wall biosynthesis
MIRFVKASPFYDTYLEEFYSNHPDMVTAPYDVQLKAIMEKGIAWADFWKINLEKTGKYQVWEIITNAKILQQQWAKERGIKFSEKNWMYEILEAQIHEIQPEIFFPHDYFHLNTEWVGEMKRKNPSIQLVIGYDGLGLGDPNRFKGFDLMISCAQFICDFYKTHGYQTLFIPLGFETTLMNRILLREPLYEVSFSGSVIVRNNFHNERLRMLSAVSDKINLSLWAASFPQHWQPWKKDQLRRLKNGKYREFFDVWKLGKINQGTKSGIEMYQLLADSKFTLNHHIDVSGSVAGNSRLTEATGAGTCLVTDWKPNLHEFFKIDEEIISFKTPEEAIDKIKYLLNHEAERKAIAQAGHKRTMEEHTFEKRILDVVNAINQLN